jgi:hypothetical protein
MVNKNKTAIFLATYGFWSKFNNKIYKKFIPDPGSKAPDPRFQEQGFNGQKKIIYLGSGSQILDLGKIYTGSRMRIWK